MNASIYCFILSLLSFRFIVLLHEFVGHGLAAYVYGFPIYGYYVSYFGGAFLVTDLTQGSLVSRLIQEGAGCLVQIIVGSVCLFFAWYYKKASTLVSFSMLVAGFCGLLHALFYLISSIILSSGDGYNLTRGLGSLQCIIFVSLSVVLACFSFLLFKVFGSYFYGWFRSNQKFLWMIRTAAMLGGVVFFAWILGPIEDYFIRSEPTNEEIKRSIQMIHNIKFYFMGNAYRFNPLTLFGPSLILVPGMLGLFLSEPSPARASDVTFTWQSIFKISSIYILILFCIFLLRLNPYCF